MLKTAARFVLDSLHHRIYMPSHMWACLRRRKPHGGGLNHDPVEEHIHEAVSWLRRAFRATDEQGVAARYTFKEGWLSAYPETTGYIIPTLIQYARFSEDSFYHVMALKLADWLLGLQEDSGGFPGGHLDQKRGPVVFNTGQILIGLLAAYRLSKDEEYLNAAHRTGQWLTEAQDDDGAWRRCTYKNRLHAYHTRVAWPLVDCGLLCDEKSFLEAGRKNLDFALALQRENGWFDENTLDEERVPFTHSLAYVARGLLEAGMLLDEDRYVEGARKLALALLQDFEARRFLAGQYDEAFRPVESFSCLTGCAQTSIVWLKLYLLGSGEEERLAKAAQRLNRQVMHCQDLHTNNPGIRGGVPGSWPLWGPYVRYGYPNWATKFLIDALLLEREVLEE